MNTYMLILGYLEQFEKAEDLLTALTGPKKESVRVYVVKGTNYDDALDHAHARAFQDGYIHSEIRAVMYQLS